MNLFSATLLGGAVLFAWGWVAGLFEWRQGMAARAAAGKPTAPWRTPALLVGVVAYVLGFAALMGVAGAVDAYRLQLWQRQWNGWSTTAGAAVQSGSPLAVADVLVMGVFIVLVFTAFLAPIVLGLWQRRRIQHRNRTYLPAAEAYQVAHPGVRFDFPLDPYLEVLLSTVEPLPTGARILYGSTLSTR